MSFSTLRHLLQQSPSRELFSEICKLFETWEEDNLVLAVDYAQEHLESWEKNLRHCENVIFQRKSVVWTRKLPSWWPLVRSYRHQGEELPQVWKNKPEILASIHLLRVISVELRDLDFLSKATSLVHLDLADSIRLQHLYEISHLTNITHLNLRFCSALRSTYGLIPLTNLTYLNLSNTGVLEVEPISTVMETRKAVQAYQQRLQAHKGSRSSWDPFAPKGLKN